MEKIRCVNLPNNLQERLVSRASISDSEGFGKGTLRPRGSGSFRTAMGSCRALSGLPGVHLHLAKCSLKHRFVAVPQW